MICLFIGGPMDGVRQEIETPLPSTIETYDCTVPKRKIGFVRTDEIDDDVPLPVETYVLGRWWGRTMGIWLYYHTDISVDDVLPTLIDKYPFPEEHQQTIAVSDTRLCAIEDEEE